MLNPIYPLYLIEYKIPRNKKYVHAGQSIMLYCSSDNAVNIATRHIFSCGINELKVSQHMISFDPIHKENIYVLRSICDDLFVTNDIKITFCSSKRMAKRIATHKFKSIPRKWNSHDEVHDIYKSQTYLHINKCPVLHGEIFQQWSSIWKLINYTLETHDSEE